MKKLLVLCSLFLISLACLLTPPQKAAATSSVDQYCSNTNLETYESIHRNGTDYRQAFTPTQNRINNIAVKVGGNGISGTAILRVYTAPTGTDNPVLRSDRNFSNLNSPVSWYFNDFGNVELTPDTTYYLSLMSSVDYLYWYTAAAESCTSAGTAYLNGSQQGYKFDYATFGYSETTAPSQESASTSTSTTSTEILGTTSSSIARPTNLTAKYSNNDKGVALNWAASTTSDIDGYKIFRSKTYSGAASKIATTGKGKTAYVDQDIIAGETYYYQIRAYKGNSQSISSNIENVTVPADTAPAKPVNFKVVDKTYNMLTVIWRKNADPNVSSYTITLYNGNDKIRSKEIPATAQLYSFFDLDSGTLYKIELTAKNSKNISSSPAVSVGFTQLPETVERFIDLTRGVAAIVVIGLLLILAVSTLKHYRKK
ncbi:hypothetical protein COT12_01370 [Candidatus Berkelbacteria bacterium CG08_land_8_20_14_0_20_39_8]|uniref:Fibronectin type-III domain-containing protein n=1 Tax=Candidatus Berkelbacteria bacterium CG08_land_8_20_14_0_20_39_8 TaxID=1974511 RepID=A0A2M6YCF4_9BACT|nr:MAG: hypothetical protein COT12_01370 [Candidatus Berkelbacteria bacterium CG08_land_8_20_14_0_20_39_8]